MEKLRPDDPEQLGPYKIIARLGSGGMGVVFLGSKGSKRVAVKVVRSSFLDNPSLRTRFQREIDTLKKLKSKHVAAYLDSEVDGELAWHAVEFINGPTLREQIEHEGPMSPAKWWSFYEDLKIALSDIHALGITHRDLKPSNIILSETGVKLIDFGIAQDSEATSITTTGTLTGSPAWLSPEHLEGIELGPASDLFAAGSILVYAATGTSPWGAETTMTVPVVFQRILSLDLRLNGVNPEFEPAIRALLRSDPTTRSFEHTPSPTSPDEVPRKPNPAAKSQRDSELQSPQMSGQLTTPSDLSKRWFDKLPMTARRGPVFAAAISSILVIVLSAYFVQTNSQGFTSLLSAEPRVKVDDVADAPFVRSFVDPATYVSQIEDIDVFWTYYAQGVVFNIELPQSSIEADRPEDITVEWDVRAIEPDLKCQSAQMDHVADTHLFRVLCLHEGSAKGEIAISVGAGEALQLTAVPIRELRSQSPGSRLSLTTSGANPDAVESGTLSDEDNRVLDDSEIFLSVSSYGDTVTVSIRVPDIPQNEVLSARATAFNIGGEPVFFSLEDENSFWEKECGENFELERQGSASQRVFTAYCGRPNMAISYFEFEFTYLGTQTSTHLLRP